MIRFRHLFHGTSSLYKASIEQSGLMPNENGLHLTTHPMVALLEARRTVQGEANLKEGYKTGVGGSPLIVVVDRCAATCLRLDMAGYYDQKDRKGYRPSELRFAFVTLNPIPPASLTFLETLETVCANLLEEVDDMVALRTFGYAIRVHLKRGLVLRQ